MGTPTKLLHGSRSDRSLLLLGSICAAVLLITAGLAVWQLHRDWISDNMGDADKFSVVLAAQTGRTFQAIDLVLRETASVALASGVRTPDEFRSALKTPEFHQLLANQLEKLPQANAIALIDSNGTVINCSSTKTLPLVNVSDRAFYSRLRENDHHDMIVDGPLINKVTGDQIVIAARRVTGPDGEFLGIVLGVVNARFFERFYQTVVTGAGESVTLLRSDGTILARFPHDDRMVGQVVPAQSPWYRHVELGGTYRTPGYLSGMARIVSVHPVRGYPLAVAAGISEDVALAPWRRQSVIIGIGVLGAIIGFGVLFRALATHFHRLEASEARFRTYALSASDWFWETDAAHRFTYISDGIRAFGQDPDSRIGRTRLELARDATVETTKWHEHLALLERHESFRDFIYTRKIGDEPESVISVSGDPYFDSSGKFLGYRGTGRDITRRVANERNLRAAKEAAETANMTRAQFLANVSHELRTPLNAIIGFSEMLEQGLAGTLNEKQQEYSQIVRQSGQHLLNVINDILDLAKIDAGKLEIHEDNAIELSPIIKACVALMRGHSAAATVSLSADVPEDLPPVVGDPIRLKQILLNLLSNGIKFTPPGGSVTVSADAQGEGKVVLAVRDTGIGMTADEVEIAFQPFGQVDAGLNRANEGTGLGLPLARRLAELHGGSLHVESQKGSGTTVTVTLPASAADWRSEQPPKAA